MVHFPDDESTELEEPRLVQMQQSGPPVHIRAERGKVTGEGNYGYTTWTFWPAEAETQLWKDIELVWSGEETAEEYLAKQQELWDKARTEGGVPPIPAR